MGIIIHRYTTITENLELKKALGMGNHQYKITNTKSPIQNHQHKITNTKSPLQNHQYKITNTKSPIQNHQYKITNTKINNMKIRNTYWGFLGPKFRNRKIHNTKIPNIS